MCPLFYCAFDLFKPAEEIQVKLTGYYLITAAAFFYNARATHNSLSMDIEHLSGIFHKQVETVRLGKY